MIKQSQMDMYRAADIANRARELASKNRDDMDDAYADSLMPKDYDIILEHEDGREPTARNMGIAFDRYQKSGKSINSTLRSFGYVPNFTRK
ncbi:MAG: hypothetical protein U9R34_08225 [Nanoarchaeota archaeon]|nr:hypothetical protein [Nanoarchaeota archaeon]